MKTEPIAYDVDGKRYVGYLATPEGDAVSAGVLVAGEGSGLGPQVKQRCHQLAELGYVAFAVDYLGDGQILSDMATMLARLGELRGDIPRVRRMARAGLAQLTARPNVDAARVAAIGYCFGGQFVLELARDGAPIAATVGFHAGLRTPNPNDAHRIRGKVLACTGADDPLVTADDRAAFEREMRDARVDWRHEIYGGAVHGFANPHAGEMGNPAVQYHEPTHRRSWESMRRLFAETID